MPSTVKKARLTKHLGLLDVFVIALGTTLSSAFFLVPGIIAKMAGPALVLTYIIAIIPLVPALLSIIELGTAMPRAGGIYYFIDRTLGPLIGTIGGFGTWFILVLKVAFALIGLGAYSAFMNHGIDPVLIAISLAIILGGISLSGSHKSSGLQTILVLSLLVVLTLFSAWGLTEVDTANFQGISQYFDFESLLAASGIVFIGYGGITKVISLSEEVVNPEKVLPKALLLTLAVSVIIFMLGTTVMVGVVPLNELIGNLTPAASAAERIFGTPGVIILSIAAIFAFIAVANAASLSASRFPLAMSRDHIMPRIFQKLSKSGTPYIAVLFTTATIILVILVFDPLKIAKLAGAFQLLMFIFVNLSVIIMRESRIESYDPGFKAPFYPWLQFVGIVGSITFILQMGTDSIVFSVGLMLLGGLWYWFYTRKRVIRTGAIYHVFERLGRYRYVGLDRELRDILKEKGLRADDPFNQIVARAMVLDVDEHATFDTIVDDVAAWISKYAAANASEIKQMFLEGNRTGATPVTHGIALPHLRLDGIEKAELVLVRARQGITIKINNPLTDNEEEEETVKAVFFLVSPIKDPAQHLRILAKIAGRVDEDSFMHAWENAHDAEEIKLAIAHEESTISITVAQGTATEFMLNNALRDIRIPEGCLIVMVRRGDEMIVPRGSTVFEEGDQLTVIGEPRALKVLKKQCGIV